MSEIVHWIELHPGGNPSAVLQAQFGFTRQALNYFFRKLAAEDKIASEGYGKGTRYFPVSGLRDPEHVLEKSFHSLELKALGARSIYLASVEPFIAPRVSPNLKRLIQHVSQALLQNVVNHAAAKTVFLRLSFAAGEFEYEIADDGLGAFQLIKDAFHLKDHYEAAGELAKGKRSSDPIRHEGDGLFLAARMADSFHLEANGLSFLYRETVDDWTIVEGKRPRGTYLSLIFDLETSKTVEGIETLYETRESPLLVAPYTIRLPKGTFPSRAEARKILSGAEAFPAVTVDFQDVGEIGQGFADEIFHLWREEHPSIITSFKNANPMVRRMIESVQK